MLVQTDTLQAGHLQEEVSKITLSFGTVLAIDNVVHR